tara:strand:- start:686 stop:1591 length:906 start_codon:yes stop_codon:yes gene_type:complete
MGYPGSRSTGRIFNPVIFGPTLGDVIQPELPRGRYPGSGDPNETYEECRARQDPNVMHFMDPCQGKPHGGFKLPEFPRSPFPRSERPSSPIPGTFGVPQPGSGRVPPAGFPMAGFPAYRLQDKIKSGDVKGAAGVLVGTVLGSVLGNIIAGRKPFDFVGERMEGGERKQNKSKADSLMRFKPDSGEFLPFEVPGSKQPAEGQPVPLTVIPYEAPLEQNQEVMGPKAQVFPRFADPGDGTLNTTPMMMAGSPSFDLSYPRISGKNLEGVPNANDPVMRKKLRDGLLKNPAGTEMLPGFLGRA